jgi:glycosyltransferase involved in cell wall biosynthesis
MPQLDQCVLFQHNVETMIWRRLAETSTGFKKIYMDRQAARMFEYEKRVCRTVRHTIAVSDIDAQLMREMFGVTNVEAVPTGVDIEYFAKPARATRESDMVFVGSMDYLPNVDGILWFTQEVLPLIRKKRPDCTLTVVGRKPPREIQAIAEADPKVKITGTVPDVRPYLWGGALSIVPLRVGGGTRLKIYESMAAGTPIVSTTIGAEGLEIHPPHDIRIGDTAEEFAAQTLALLDSESQRDAVAQAAWELVNAKFSWEKIARDFENILERTSAGATV